MSNTSIHRFAPTLPADLDALVTRIETLDLADLRAEWRRQLRSAPPGNLPRWLLAMLLGYKVQARHFGDLDPETAKYLDTVAKARLKRIAAKEKRNPKHPPPVPPVPDTRSTMAGCLLVREYAGIVHRVMVVNGGYAWNGATYASLSEIARLITGTRWSGPRFFGLKDKGESECKGKVAAKREAVPTAQPGAAR